MAVKVSGTTVIDSSRNIVNVGNVDGRDLSIDGSKLDGIEAGATADQTPSEIKTAYESNADTNAFTDSEKSKLGGIEAGADVTDTANVTAAGALMDSEVANLAAVKAFDPTDYATAAQGALADTAIQPSDNVSTLTNDVGYVTSLSDLSITATTTELNHTDGVTSNIQTQINGKADQASATGLFAKADASEVAWTKTGNGTAETQTALTVEVNGSVLTVASGTSITMPALTAGTDYAIWLETDGDLVATTNHTSPPTANARKVGGFHYAAGGNATAQSGGNTTAQINEYSFWDLNFRPACPDPRGMTLVADGFWVDIYLTGVDAITNGSSKYNVTIADGSSPPKVPTMFGGDGSTTYGSYTWFEAQELATAFGKRTLTQLEFMSAMYGTTEASSIGSDPSTTNWDAAYVSKWGINQATGCMWVWGRDRGGPAAAASWNANTEGRGSEFNAPNAVRVGGHWNSGSDSGSRCSRWNLAASNSSGGIGSRFACDHLQLG